MYKESKKLLVLGLVVMWHTKKSGSLQEASELVRIALDSGKVLDRLK